MRRILLLAYMFPPIVDAGGFRPLAMARYLPEFGYSPTVVTRPDTGTLPTDERQIRHIPPSVSVQRVATGFLDGWQEHWRRRFSWMVPLERIGRKPRGWFADALAWRIARLDEPRVWERSWMYPSVATGLEALSRQSHAAIVATAPPYESLKAGWLLHRKTGLPLVADFRDPWTYGVHWPPKTRWRTRREIAWERQVVRDAAAIVVVTPAMQKEMVRAYPDREADITVVMNGYDDFHSADGADAPPADRFVLSYVGSVMPRRMPSVLFEAIRRLRLLNPRAANDTRIQFIGPNQTGSVIEERLAAEGVQDVVKYLGPVGHDESRAKMRQSHVLLHIETVASYAVSSKLFEYLAAGRPIIGLVPHGSDDETLLLRSGVGANTGINDADALARAIEELWRQWHAGEVHHGVDPSWLRQFHRREQMRNFAKVIDRVTQIEKERVGLPS